MLYPVLVFLPGVKPLSVYKISRNWVGEFTLNSRPAIVRNVAASVVVSSAKRSRMTSSARRSTPTPTLSIFANTCTSGFSILLYKSVLEMSFNFAVRTGFNAATKSAASDVARTLSSFDSPPKSNCPDDSTPAEGAEPKKDNETSDNE